MENKEEKQRWKIKSLSALPKMKTPVLIEGLPGIGNVSKIAIDFLIEKKNAKKIMEFSSFDLPHSAIIQEDNTVLRPKIEIYHLKEGKNDFLLLSGDAQPITERACYEFCDMLLRFAKKMNVKEILSTGGFGLPQIVKEPQVYCIANDTKFLKKISKKTNAITDVYGSMGPIAGVTGVLVTLAREIEMPGAIFLAETFAYPFHLGMQGARALLDNITKLYGIKIDMKDLDQEIQDIEKELRSTTITKQPDTDDEQLNYIG